MAIILRFIHAGLVVAGRQLVAVVAVSLLVSQNLDQRESTLGVDAELLWNSISPLLTWAYLLIAVGLALTDDRFVVQTGEHIRRVSDLMHLVGERRAARRVAFQFGLSAALFAILALQKPPEFLTEVSRYFGYASAASIGWAGSMSVGVACFGAIAHAAVKAHRSQRLSP